MEGNSLQSVIDLAIQKEEEAYSFYMNLRNVVEDDTVKDTLKYLANEESQHKAFLVKCKEQISCDVGLRSDQSVDYRLAEHLNQPDIKKNIDSAEVYLIAANRELNAYNFYTGLANYFPAGPEKALFLKMADEEMKHKEKMEYLYSNTAFPQTAGG
jgi:rubrerythrin